MSEEADAVVSSVVERQIPVIWKVNGTNRLLVKSKTQLKEVLLLLYARPSGVSEAELVASLEIESPSIFRRDVLRKGHANRMLEYSEPSRMVTLSPLGIRAVEQEVLPEANRQLGMAS